MLASCIYENLETYKRFSLFRDKTCVSIEKVLEFKLNLVQAMVRLKRIMIGVKKNM